MRDISVEDLEEKLKTDEGREEVLNDPWGFDRILMIQEVREKLYDKDPQNGATS